MRRRDFLKTAGAAGVVSATSMAAPAFIKNAWAGGGTVKVGALFSSSGAMANVEGRLNYVVQMAVDELNAKGGVLGKTVELIKTDPGSNWPLYAQQGRQLLQQEKVASMFGCWTSASRVAVLPVVEQNKGMLYYPLHFEGEENSKNIVYMGTPPSSSVLPAVDYLMSDNGGKARRFFMLGADYVWPRTINAILKGYWKKKWNIGPDSWEEKYVPVGHSNFQDLVSQIRAFADKPGGQPIVVLTVVGNSIPDFFKEYINQGVSPLDLPVIALDMVESDLEGLDASKMVGTLNCWSYLQTEQSPKNKQFLEAWSSYVKKAKVPFSPDVSIAPMVSAYDAVHMWAMAAEKAGSFDVPQVRAAFPDLTLKDPSGYDIKMTAENNYVWRGVYIGSSNRDKQFDIAWKSPSIVKPVPFSPYV